VRKIRVLLVISNLEYGGAQRQVVELANNLNPSRVEVHICSLSPYVPLAPALKLPADRLHLVVKRAKYDLTVLPRLARLIGRIRPDVVHGYLFDAEIAARLAGRARRVPVIAGSERNTDYHLKRVQLLAYGLTRSQVDLVIANSTAGAAFNSRTLGHPIEMYRVIHNGVDLRRFSPGDRAAARDRLKLPADGPIVGMFASFKEQKNHPLLFAAAAIVVRRMPDLRLLLIGDELHAGMHGSREYRARMDTLVDELGLRKHCIFLGNQDEVEHIYPACDITVLASLFEGTPNVALESMACGVPVVATDVADNALVIPDARAGFIVPLGDAAMMADRIERLLGDAPLREGMGRSARQWVEQQFSTERLAEKTEAVYREWLARGAHEGVA
jgi:glycosyltransferase involved in cell wall biosynthesis